MIAASTLILCWVNKFSVSLMLFFVHSLIGSALFHVFWFDITKVPLTSQVEYQQLSVLHTCHRRNLSGFQFCQQWCFLVFGWEWTLDNVLQHLHKRWSIGLTPFVILGSKLGKINWQVKEVSNLMLYAQSTSTAIWGQWQVKEIKL